MLADPTNKLTVEDAIRAVRAKLPKSPREWPAATHIREDIRTGGDSPGCILQRACSMLGVKEFAHDIWDIAWLLVPDEKESDRRAHIAEIAHRYDETVDTPRGSDLLDALQIERMEKLDASIALLGK